MRLDSAAFIRENLLAGSTIEASLAFTGFGAENVLARSSDVIYRTIETDAFLEFDMGAAREIGAFLIRLPGERDPDLPAGSPLATSSEITVTGWLDRADAPVFSATFAAGHDPRLGYVAHILTAGGAPTTFNVRHVRFDFENTGQLDIDAIWAGALWQPQFQYNTGGVFGFDERAETGRSEFSGRRFGETKSRILTAVLSFDAWGAPALSEWEDFIMGTGLVRPFVFFRTLTAPLARRVMVATFAQSAQQNDRDGVHFLIRADLTEDL